MNDAAWNPCKPCHQFTRERCIVSPYLLLFHRREGNQCQKREKNSAILKRATTERRTGWSGRNLDDHTVSWIRCGRMMQSDDTGLRRDGEKGETNRVEWIDQNNTVLGRRRGTKSVIKLLYAQEMKVLQGVSVLTCVWAREWQYKDILNDIDGLMWNIGKNTWMREEKAL